MILLTFFRCWTSFFCIWELFIQLTITTTVSIQMKMKCLIAVESCTPEVLLLQPRWCLNKPDLFSVLHNTSLYCSFFFPLRLHSKKSRITAGCLNKRLPHSCSPLLKYQTKSTQNLALKMPIRILSCLAYWIYKVGQISIFILKCSGSEFLFPWRNCYFVQAVTVLNIICQWSRKVCPIQHPGTGQRQVAMSSFREEVQRAWVCSETYLQQTWRESGRSEKGG